MFVSLDCTIDFTSCLGRRREHAQPVSHSHAMTAQRVQSFHAVNAPISRNEGTRSPGREHIRALSHTHTCHKLVHSLELLARFDQLLVRTHYQRRHLAAATNPSFSVGSCISGGLPVERVWGLGFGVEGTSPTIQRISVILSAIIW
eukprot:2287431-Rhodomonas_salina.1